MNLKELLQLKGIEVHDGSTPDEIWICCPFCHEQGETSDTKFRLGVNYRKNKGHCFNCEWSSGKDTINKVLKALDIQGEVESSSTVKAEKKKFEKHLPESFEYLYPKKKDKDFRKALHYLYSRGITDSQIKKYKIGFCLAGKYSDRIIFPIIINHKLRGFIGRTFIDHPLRYKNSKGKKAIYGVPKYKKDTCLLVEGVIDKLSAEQVLFEVDVIGIPGRVLQDSDIKYLKGYKKIIRVPDDDGPGLRGALRDLKKLQKNKVYISYLKGWKDINKAFTKRDYKAIVRLINKAKEFTYSQEIKLKTKIATDYRGVRKING